MEKQKVHLDLLGDVEYVKEEPNEVWDQSEYNDLLEKLQDAQSDLNSLDTDQDYKEIASELIALTCIKEAIDELQKQENGFISQKLLEKSDQLQSVVPGRFSKLSWDGENLMIEDSSSRIDHITGRSKTPRSPLATLSTGANEQIMLLLRKIFAEDYFDEESGFHCLMMLFNTVIGNEEKVWLIILYNLLQIMIGKFFTFQWMTIWQP